MSAGRLQGHGRQVQQRLGKLSHGESIGQKLKCSPEAAQPAFPVVTAGGVEWFLLTMFPCHVPGPTAHSKFSSCTFTTLMLSLPMLHNCHLNKLNHRKLVHTYLPCTNQGENGGRGKHVHSQLLRCNGWGCRILTIIWVISTMVHFTWSFTFNKIVPPC